MKISEYYHKVLLPANTAVTAMQRNGLPVSTQRAQAQMENWEKELKRLERYVEGEAAKRGIHLQYSKAHSAPEKPMVEFLFSPKGLGLESKKKTEGGNREAMDDEALMPYAAIGPLHQDDDHPIVHAILQIRSIAKARSTHLGGLIKWRRADGACHPHFKWILPNTTRLSAENPPVHQLPEKSDPELARKVKACIVPRRDPWLGPPQDWNPMKHGWVLKADVKGAEAIVRAGAIARCRVSSPYLRAGKDIHSRTASVLYGVPEGTYKKGTPQRDSVGKQSYFLFIFGGSWKALQITMWRKARIWVEDSEAKRLTEAFFGPEGYPDLRDRYKVDTLLMFQRGYIEDFYGRRWTLPPPSGVRAYEKPTGEIGFEFPVSQEKDAAKRDYENAELMRQLQNRQHIYANRPTQASQATTTLWCLALCHHGEYVELASPPCLGDLAFPEAAGWSLDEGPGPGGKPLLAWMNNTVHDSGWGDGAPGHLEPAVKVIVRRFTGVPADFLIESDMPWRVDCEVGPDLGNLYPYNEVAKKFGLDPIDR